MDVVVLLTAALPIPYDALSVDASPPSARSAPWVSRLKICQSMDIGPELCYTERTERVERTEK